jgi:hypothetical protein
MARPRTVSTTDRPAVKVSFLLAPDAADSLALSAKKLGMSVSAFARDTLTSMLPEMANIPAETHSETCDTDEDCAPSCPASETPTSF